MKKNRISILAMLAIACTMQAHAQNVAINADGALPDPNAALDIKSSNKGILIPRISMSARLALPSTKGLMVYDTVYNSFWYNTGAGWRAIAPESYDGYWSRKGEINTHDSGFFIGTRDLAPFVIKVNDSLSGRIDADMRNLFLGYKAGISSSTMISQGARDSGNYPSLTAIGHSALYSNTTGSWNTATGREALYLNTEGSGNTATGYNALYSNKSGSNTATGIRSMYYNTTGQSNAAHGSYSLTSNTTGSYNAALGHQALDNNATGDFNTAVGMNSMYHNTTGSYNTGIGYGAGGGNSSGTANTFIGANTATFGVYTNSTAIGNGAQITASNKIRLGNSAVTVIEGQVPFTTPSDGRFKYDVKEDVRGLDFILQLRPVTYRFDVGRFDAQHGNPQEAKGNTNANYALQAAYNDASLIRRSGFIAQEVEKAAKASGYDFSGIITPKTEQEHYSLSYESFVVPLVKAVQEQQKTIDAQNKTIAGLQQQLDEIKQLLQHTK